MPHAKLSLSVDCDRRLVAVEVSSQRTVEWIVQAARAEETAARPPLNLALVLDRSGSMRGDKLRYVQRAATYVLDLLDERDRVAVIAYDDEVRVVQPSAAVTEHVRSELKRQIEALRAGGQTALAGGWLRGCQEAAGDWTGVSRALLLTDGLANHGITDVEELARHARELRRRGVATSTFGVGLDFNEELLEAMAEQGGGHFFYIERPEQIPDVFRRELGELLAVVAREALLSVPVPKGLSVEVLGDLPHERDGDRLRIFLGDLSTGEQRALYTRVLLSPDAAGTAVVLRGELQYADEDAEMVVLTAEQWFSYTRQPEVMRLPAHEELLRRASAVEMATATARALKLERGGARKEAQTLLVRAMAAQGPYLSAADSAHYGAVAENMAGGLSEAERKQRHFDAYRLRKQRD